MTRLGVALTAAVLGLGMATTGAVAEAGAPSIRDVRMTTTFDKPSYDTGETITMTVTVTNTGARPVTLDAYFFSSPPDAIAVDYPNPFESASPFTLDAGASRTHELTGTMGNPDVTTATLHAWLSDPSGTAQPFEFTVPVTPTFGHAAGIVWVDRDHNEAYDAGEGQGGVVVTFAGATGETVTTTAADGRFAIDRLAGGRYFVSGRDADGLTIAYRTVTVSGAGVDDLSFRAYEPLTELTADLEFTRETYARDEAPVVTVSLTNDTDHALVGIVANCDRGDFGTSLDGRSPGWGALIGDGVTIAANSTLVLEVTEPMPAAAYEHGFVAVGCDFGYRDVEDFEHMPSDNDRALVPGQVGDAGGHVVHEDTGIALVRLVLVPETGGCPTAETTTDAAGEFAFHQVPVGEYDLYLFPPAGWHVTGNPTHLGVVGNEPATLYIDLTPGDQPPPTLPDCPAHR
ncbi:hypothetical protein GCM10027436_50360 [Actinophytocola sediminis]